MIKKVVSNEILFITVTMDPSLYTYKLSYQANLLKSVLQKIFKSKEVIYEGCIEATKNDNAHAHIIIYDAPAKKAFKTFWRNKFRRDGRGRLSELGFCKLENLCNMEAVYRAWKYTNKDIQITYDKINNDKSVNFSPKMQRLNDEWTGIIKGFEARREIEKNGT